MNRTRDEKEMLEERLIRWEDGELGPEETEGLIQLLQEDQSARRKLVMHCLLDAGIARELNTGDAQNKRARSVALPGSRLLGRRWVIPLAAAASLMIAVGGAWWFNRPQAGSLELRVVEVQGSVFRGQAVVTESPSHPVTESGEGMNAQRPTPNAQHPNGEAGATLATRHSTLKIGDVIRPGDGVEVGANGYAKLVYPDRTRVELQQNTRLRVTLEAGKAKNAKRLALEAGTLVCSAAAQRKVFAIQTPHVVARVVGTQFSLGVREAESRLEVQEGKVALIQGDKILEVTAGKAAIATATGMEMARGVVYTWGNNQFGQLGIGTTNDSPNPVLVPELDGVMAVAAEFGHTVALKADGSVVAWGRNDMGQLGDGATTERLRPVPGLSGIVAIDVGDMHTVALKNDGGVWAWGRNADGQLGDGTTNNRAIPVQVVGISEVTAIAAGQHYAVALKRDQTVWAWGRNGYGQLGDGTHRNNRLVPVQVRMADGTPLGGVMGITAGYKHTVALKSDGSVWAWGREGPSSASDRLTPMPVKLADGSPLSGVIAIAAGAYHTVALKADGTVLGWGDRERGALGSGDSSGNRLVPVPVKLPDGSPLSGITAIATGLRHTVARKDDGTLWAWGSNSYGQLGDGTVTKTGEAGKPTPVQVKKQDGTPLGGIIAIAAGESHTVAVAGE
jgi:alpha-tubulin suppressor-like RCC1 family protein